MTLTVKGTLYYAHWCGHCKRFEPEWDKFAEKIEEAGGKLNNVKINVDKIEDNKIEKGSALINGKEIRGYPTVKISVTKKGGKPVEYEYSGKRDVESLIDHFTNDAPKKLSG